MKKTSSKPWTDEMKLALAKARMRLRTNKRIAEETGAHATVIGNCLNKNGGRISARTYESLLALEEFAEIAEDRQNKPCSEWSQLSDDEKLLVEVFRELPEPEHSRFLIHVLKQLRMRESDLRP